MPEFNNKLVFYPAFLIVPGTTVLHIARRAILLNCVKSLMIGPFQALLIFSPKLDRQGGQAWELEGIWESSYKKVSLSSCHSHGSTGFFSFCLLVYSLFVAVH